MRRVFPAYGRELMNRRLGGDHPSVDEAVLVALEFWPRVGDRPPAWPRRSIVVITDDMPIARLELRMLAGTSLIVAFESARLERARELSARLLEIAPRDEALWCVDYEAGKVWTVWREGWVPEFRAFAEYWLPLIDEF